MKNFWIRRHDAMRLLRMWKLKQPPVGDAVLLPTGAKLYNTKGGRLRWFIGGYAWDGADIKATVMMLL